MIRSVITVANWVVLTKIDADRNSSQTKASVAFGVILNKDYGTNRYSSTWYWVHLDDISINEYLSAVSIYALQKPRLFFNILMLFCQYKISSYKYQTVASKFYVYNGNRIHKEMVLSWRSCGGYVYRGDIGCIAAHFTFGKWWINWRGMIGTKYYL